MFKTTNFFSLYIKIKYHYISYFFTNIFKKYPSSITFYLVRNCTRSPSIHNYNISYINTPCKNVVNCYNFYV